MENKDISLRDYFAAQTIQRCMTPKPVTIRNKFLALIGREYQAPVVNADTAAKNAYKIADAMLRQREIKHEDIFTKDI